MAISKIVNIFKDVLPSPLRQSGLMGGDISSTDFNDYTTTGTYLNGGTQGYSNRPTNDPDNGYLFVYASTCVIQVWIGTYLGTMYVRRKKNGTWSNWTTLVNWGG